MARGIFISFEGSEGCGKSTQIELLSQRCKELSRPVLVTREPGGTGIGETIRHLIKYSEDGRAMKPETELLLFTASRAQLVREKIEPALAAGAVVIADRFLDSTTVYQGIARRIDPAAVGFINEFAVGSCRPDITLVLDLDSQLAQARMRARTSSTEAADRMEQESLAFYEKVREGYLQLASKEPDRITVIDASQGVEEIHARIWSLLQDKFHGVL